MLQIRVETDHETVSRRAADWLGERLAEHPDALWCLASGSTPSRTYELLAQRGAQQPSLFAALRVIKLDEWGGLPTDDAATCERHLRATIVEPLGLSDRYVGFDGHAPEPAAECARVADWLERHGPVDVCVLGLGVNGHLGFNEPAERLQPHAHVSQLSAASQAHAMVQSLGTPPSFGLTLGMADILQSRRILVLATGPTKRQPLARLRMSGVTTAFPASLLQLHPNVLVLCDADAFGP